MNRLVVVAILLMGASGSSATELRWNGNSLDAQVEVFNVPQRTLTAWLATKPDPSDWQKLITVRVVQPSVVDDVDTLPMLGRYEARDGTLVFTPEFPLQPGLRYRAEFRPAALPGGKVGAKPLVSLLAVTPPPQTPPTIVSDVYPSASELPENLLKFYLHFSAPMSRGHIYDHIRLLDAQGAPVELPFLEIDEELWNADMTRLTLFIDPGRIKRGLKPLEEIGPSLEAGKAYTLVIAREWRDASGQPLAETFRKPFTVVAPDRRPPDPKRWAIRAPHFATQDALVIEFDEPLDEALVRRLIRVYRDGKEVEIIIASLDGEERRLHLTPSEPWVRGEHQITVQTTIEDLAGNNIGKPFEVDLFERVERRLTNAVVKLPFTVSR